MEVFLLVSKDDQFEDMAPDEEENLEIFAKEIKIVTDSDEQDYTLIEVYRIDKCRSDFSDISVIMGQLSRCGTPIQCITRLVSLLLLNLILWRNLMTRYVLKNLLIACKCMSMPSSGDFCFLVIQM